MAKNCSARKAQGDGAAGGAGGHSTRRPPVTLVSTTTTAKTVLQDALTALDAIAQEAHTYAQRQQQRGDEEVGGGSGGGSGHRKRAREDAAEGSPPAPLPSSGSHAALLPDKTDLFSAMSKPHYEVIGTAVAAYGLQLLPLLEDMTRRVGLAVATPALASVESWETAAMLCTYYRAGATRLLEELIAVLFRVPGLFLLDAACVVPTAVIDDYRQQLQFQQHGHAPSPSPSSGQRQQQLVDRPVRMQRVTRKLNALRDMLCATGPYIAMPTLLQFAQRFAHDVVEQGMFSATESAAHGTQLTATMGTAGTVAGAAAVSPAPLWRWPVPAEWQPACLRLLTTLLQLARPAPADVAVCAIHAVVEVSTRLQRGVAVEDAVAEKTPGGAPTTNAATLLLPSCHTYRDLMAAVTELSQCVHVLRHPSAIAFYTPPQTVVEKAKRKRFVQEEEEAEVAVKEESSVPAPSAQSNTASSVQQKGVNRAPASLLPSTSPAKAVVPPPPATAAVPAQTSGGATLSPAATSPSAKRATSPPSPSTNRSNPAAMSTLSSVASAPVASVAKHVPPQLQQPSPTAVFKSSSTSGPSVAPTHPASKTDDDQEEEDIPDIDMED